jgi:cyclophilin family peptidyl-prolyl cis-trans isomerase
VSTPDLNTRKFNQGSIAFANSGPDTNSTEIFVVTSKEPESSNVRYLNGRFTNFGTLVEGHDVLTLLNELGEKDSDGKPSDKVVIMKSVAK